MAKKYPIVGPEERYLRFADYSVCTMKDSNGQVCNRKFYPKKKNDAGIAALYIHQVREHDLRTGYGGGDKRPAPKVKGRPRGRPRKNPAPDTPVTTTVSQVSPTVPATSAPVTLPDEDEDDILDTEDQDEEELEELEEDDTMTEDDDVTFSVDDLPPVEPRFQRPVPRDDVDDVDDLDMEDDSDFDTEEPLPSPEQVVIEQREARLKRSLKAFSYCIKDPWPKVIMRQWKNFDEFKHDPNELYNFMLRKVQVDPAEIKRFVDKVFEDKYRKPQQPATSPYSAVYPTEAPQSTRESPTNPYPRNEFRQRDFEFEVEEEEEDDSMDEATMQRLLAEERARLKLEMEAESEKKARALFEAMKREDDLKREAERTRQEVSSLKETVDQFIQNQSNPKPREDDPLLRELKEEQANARKELEKMKIELAKVEFEKKLSEQAKKHEKELHEVQLELEKAKAGNISTDGIVSDDTRLQLARENSKQKIRELTVDQFFSLARDFFVNPPPGTPTSVEEAMEGSTFMSEADREAVLSSIPPDGGPPVQAEEPTITKTIIDKAAELGKKALGGGKGPNGPRPPSKPLPIMDLETAAALTPATNTEEGHNE